MMFGSWYDQLTGQVVVMPADPQQVHPLLYLPWDHQTYGWLDPPGALLQESANHRTGPPFSANQDPATSQQPTAHQIGSSETAFGQKVQTKCYLNIGESNFNKFLWVLVNWLKIKSFWILNQLLQYIHAPGSSRHKRPINLNLNFYGCSTNIL